MPESKTGGRGRRQKPAQAAEATVPPLLTEDARLQLLLATTSGPTLASRTRRALAAFAKQLTAWVKASAERVVLYAAVGFAIGWLFNAVVMSVGYNGYGKVPQGGPATGSGNEVLGGIFTFGLTAIIVALISRRRRVGGQRFWADVRAFPGSIAALTREDGERAVAHLLWGFAGSMLVILVIGPWIVGALAVGFLVGLVSVFRSIIVGSLMIVWRAIGSRLTSGKAKPPAPAAMTVAGLGGVAAVIFGISLPTPELQLLACGAAAVAAFVLGRRSASPKAAAMLVLGALAIALALRRNIVLASDGGFQECGGDIFNCPGIDQIALQAAIGGLAGALGAVAGGAIGDHSPARDHSPHHPPCGQDGANAVVSDWQKWQATHPGEGGAPPTVGSESWREFMANRIEFHRQAADIKLKTEWDQPLDKIKADAANIDDQLAQTQRDMHKADLILKLVDDTSNLGPSGWQRLADNLSQDLSSGEAFKRAALTGLKLPAAAVVGTYEAGKGLVQLPEMTGYAVGWWTQNLFNPTVRNAAVSEFGQAAMDQFTTTMDKLGGGTRSEQSDIVSNIAGSFAGGEILSWGLGNILSASRAGTLPASAGDIPAGGIALDTAEKRAAVGHSEDAARGFQQAADDNNVRPQMERRSPEAIANEGSSYMKSEAMKDLKSLHAYNASVGGPGSESTGMLGLFEPTPPPWYASQAVKDAYGEARKVYDGIPGADIAAKRAYYETKKITVYVDGEKQVFQPKFDDRGLLVNGADGRPVNTDYDGWDTLSGDGSRSLGYNADGTKASAAMQSADRRAGVGFIKDAQRGAPQLQHSNRTRLWDPLPQLKWGGEELPCFDCKLSQIASRKAAKVANEGVVEYRPGSVDANGNPVPYLTQAHGTTPPPPTPWSPGAADAARAAGPAGAATSAATGGGADSSPADPAADPGPADSGVDASDPPVTDPGAP